MVRFIGSRRVGSQHPATRLTSSTQGRGWEPENGSQRVQPPSDAIRPDQILLAGHGLLVRLSPTVADTRNRPGIP